MRSWNLCCDGMSDDDSDSNRAIAKATSELGLRAGTHAELFGPTSTTTA